MELFFTSMSSRSVCRLLTYLITIVFLVSCKKEKAAIEDLRIAEQTYYVVEGKAAFIPIGTGNKNYSISVADEELVEATVDVTAWPAGEIILKGIGKGETVLSIQDLVTGQKIEVPIRVVDPFLVMRAGHTLALVRGGDAATQKAIRDELGSFKPFGLNEWLILQKNEYKPFFVFEDQQKMKDGVVWLDGIYDMPFSFGGPNRLMLNYTDTGRDAMTGAIFAPDRVFSSLFEFAIGERYIDNLKAAIDPSKDVYGDSPAYANDSFRLVFDFTEQFRVQYPEVTVVEFFQDMHLMPERSNPAIGGTVLQ